MNKGIHNLPKSRTTTQSVPLAIAANKVSQTPDPIKDFIQLTNPYANWIMGTGTAQGTKWDTMTTYHTNYLDLTFMGGWANGAPISHTNIGQTIHVDYYNLYYRNDGYGVFAGNYVDFLNRIFSDLDLYTKAIGNSDNKVYWNYCKTDDFRLIFEENGVITGYNIGLPLYYSVGSMGGYSMIDHFNQDIYSVYLETIKNGRLITS
jgi:hypothetical protein